MCRRAEIGGLFANPGEEALNLGMGGEGFEGIEFAFVAFVGVRRPRDEMMGSEHRDVTAAQFARVSFVHLRRPYIN